MGIEMRIRVVSILALVGALSGSPAPAQVSTVDQRQAAASDGTVKITNAVGAITVTGWDRDTVWVSGQLGVSADRLEFSTNERETRIRVVIPADSHVLEGSRLDVRVPRNSHIAVRTSAADIEVTDVDGAVDLESVSGSITVTGRPRMVYAESAGGDLRIDAISKVVRAKSVDGQVEVLQARGYLEVSTVSGAAEVEGRGIWEGEITSVAGDITFSGDFDPSGSFYFESHSGSIELRLPADISADFDVMSLKGGAIQNQFAPADQRSFSAGGGGTQVRIKSFKGKIRLLKRD